MSTTVQGIVMNPYGFIPVSGVTVVAQSTDGYSEGTSTTDSNGWFSISGLTNRNWLAKITSAPPFVGNILLLPVNVDHADLSSVSEDQHHAGFVGLSDSAGALVNPNSDDRIQITDDGMINADVTDEGGVLSLTIDLDQIAHGSLANVDEDDHGRYADLTGRSGGQEFYGGLDSGDDLTLYSTSHATKGSVFLGSSTLFELAESSGRLLLPTVGSSAGILIGGDALWYRSAADVMRTPDAVTIDGLLTASGGIASTYSLHTYVFVPDAGAGSDVSTGDGQGIHHHSGDNDETVVGWYIDSETAPTGDSLDIQLEFGNTDDLDTVASWTEIDAEVLAAGSKTVKLTGSFTNGTITANRLIRMNVDQVGSTVPGKDVAIHLVVKRPLVT